MYQLKLHPLIKVCGVVLVCMCVVCAFSIIFHVPKWSIKPSEIDQKVGHLAAHVAMHWEEHCAFPAEFEPTGDPRGICGGGRHQPYMWNEGEMSRILGVDPLHFVYSGRVSEVGMESHYTIMGQADFECDSPQMHTHEVQVVGVKSADGKTCKATVMPRQIFHEFE